jgi:hypothetical protein
LLLSFSYNRQSFPKAPLAAGAFLAFFPVAT